MAVDEQYITAMKNRAKYQFTGSIRQIFAYLLTTYRKKSPSQLNDSEKQLTEIHYDPVTPVKKIST